MADPMKVRATLKGDVVDIRVLMGHPMETGQRKDSSGKPIPRHFIQQVLVKVGGKVAVDGEISQAVSRNPVFSFRLKGVSKGEKVEISWVDNKGEKNQTETAIA